MTDLSNARIGRWERKERTHCSAGHLYNEANTGWKLNRKRYRCRECRECGRLRMQRNRENPEVKLRDAAKAKAFRERHADTYNLHVQAERRKKKEWLDAFKVSCGRCPETHIACLEFHHRNPAKKDFLLSVGVAKYSLKRLQAEVEKCEVICSNCHRKLHWEERQQSKASEGV